ncbi:MAG: methionine-R-sulfoxide reductase [Patescibacteria group bacterium]|nr:methionine-R-sulfoxide reductase [Patescibacteria group bacterium]
MDIQNNLNLNKNTSDSEWKEKLTAEQYRALRQKETEYPGTGEYENTFKDGTYVCAACEQPIFDSTYKYDSGCGWPAFDRAIPGSVDFTDDYTENMHRIEITCSRCGGHLGHVFPDGPIKGYQFKPGVISTGERFCVNSVSMKFIPKKQA